MHNVTLRTAERNGFDGDPAGILDKPSPKLTLATRHIELLTGSASTYVQVRLHRGKDDTGHSLSGRIVNLWSEIEAAQRRGWQPFIVVNDGGHSTREITRVRAFFVDGDGVPTPTVWHVRPDFIVRRDAEHWHAYWLVADMTKNSLNAYFGGTFKDAQKRLAAYYKTDRKVNDLPRVMRLAGSLHLKNPAQPFLVTIEGDGDARSPNSARTTAELLAGLPELVAARAAAAGMPSGEPISLEILHDMLGYLDPGVERDDWRDIIAAIHAAPVPGDDDKSGRRQLAQDWSEGAHNYDGPEDVDRTFDTMLPGRGVTVATLIKRARAAGYDGPISIAEAERIRVWSAIAAEQAEADCWSKRTGAQPPTDFVFPKEFIEHARQQTAEAERRLNEAFPASDMEANRNV